MPVEISKVDNLLKDMARLGYMLDMLSKIGVRGVNPNLADIELIDEEASVNADKYRANLTDRIIMRHSMSDEIIDVLRGNAKKSIENIKRAYNSEGTFEADMQRHADIARRDFCWSLHRIKGHNKGILPADLAKDWEDHLCSMYNFLP